MVKILLCIAIVVFTSVCGYIFARKYRQRKQFFQQLFLFNERFLSEITYYRRPLRVFAEKYTYKGAFHTFLSNFFYALNDKEQNANVSLTFENCEFLTKEERGMLEDYFHMLGAGDSASQKAYFSGMKSLVASHQADAEKEYKKYGDLYIKLGFLCGLLIVILIV